MKIAIDARPINHHRRQGIFVYTEKLIYELAKIDTSNRYFLIYCSLRKKTDELPGPNNANFMKKVIRVPDRNFIFDKAYLSKVALPRFLKQSGCNVFHSTFDTLQLKTKQCRYVLTIYDLKSLYVREDQWNQHLPSYAKAMKCADVIIAISQSTKNDIVRHFSSPEQKVRVVYLGVDESFQKLDNQTVQAVLKKYSLTKRYFLTDGRVPRKNAERVIQAFAQFKYNNDYELVLLGVTPDCMLVPRYKQLIEEYKLSERVKLIPNIESIAEMAALYNGAFCFIFPSLYEGFGLSVLEAMACGTPVITSNVSSLPEVGGEAALYVDPQSVTEIMNAMTKMSDDNLLRQSLIEKSRNRIKMFSWRKMAAETLAIYKEVAH